MVTGSEKWAGLEKLALIRVVQNSKPVNTILMPISEETLTGISSPADSVEINTWNLQHC